MHQHTPSHTLSHPTHISYWVGTLHDHMSQMMTVPNNTPCWHIMLHLTYSLTHPLTHEPTHFTHHISFRVHSVPHPLSHSNLPSSHTHQSFLYDTISHIHPLLHSLQVVMYWSCYEDVWTTVIIDIIIYMQEIVTVEVVVVVIIVMVEVRAMVKIVVHPGLD